MAMPVVTAIVTQMIDRNVGMAETPQTLKVAVMASCYYNAGTTFNNNISDKEGAGVNYFCFLLQYTAICAMVTKKVCR